MDISVTGSEGLPPKAYISIRAGETRRQAPFTNKEVFRFPAGSYKSVVVDVFEKLGTAQVPLSGEAAAEEQRLCIKRTDGSKIGVDLKMELLGASSPAKPKPKASHQEVAMRAKNYLEDHGVQKLLQDMVHSLLAQQPDNPVDFMYDFIGQRKDNKAPAKTSHFEPVPLTAAPPAQCSGPWPSLQVVVPGLGEEELPGFPVDECPEEMPNLSAHFSIMAEVLKKDPSVYSSLRGLSTKNGVTFAKVLKPGMDNRGHRMIKTAGIYAGDAECYSTFGPLFAPILSLRYGGPAAGEKQPLELDAFKVSPGPIDPDGRHVISVQARLSRNLASLRFPTACSFEERREVERIIAGALLDLSGELQGEYQPLAGSDSFLARPGGMGPGEEQALEAHGALFLEPDSTIALSSGLGRHWPDARGVYITDSGNLWAWINEEDHMRLTSWEEGSDLRSAFARLCLAEGAVRQSVQQAGHNFARCGRFGYLASSPGHAGTSFTASASLRVPLMAKQQGFRQLCSQLKLQVQQTSLGVWTVSSNEKFGSSEVQQVERVITGCRELVGREKQLEMEAAPGLHTPLSVPGLEMKARDSGAPGEEEEEEEEPDGMSDSGCAPGLVPGLGDEEYPGFSAVQCPDEMPDLSTNFSLMTDVLKKAGGIYGRLKERRTKLGVPFAKIIKPGIDIKGHAMIKTVGAVAGDEESYEVFRELLDKVIFLRHGGFGGDMCQRAELDPAKVDSSPVDPTGRTVLFTRLTAVRNLRGFRLPSACSLDERREVERMAAEALLSLGSDFQGDYYPLDGSPSYPSMPNGMTEAQEDWLSANKLLFEEPDASIMLASGMGRNWPDARGIFANKKADFAAWVNEEDHLRLFVNQQGAGISEAFARLVRAHQELEEKLKTTGFMKNERLGFITSCPSNLGAGLKATVTVKVPHLKAAGNFKELCALLQLSARSLGNSDNTTWDLSSNLGLGTSEVDILNSVIRGCRHIAQLEEALSKGESIAQPGLGPNALPGFGDEGCPAVMPNFCGHRHVLAKTLRADPSIYERLRDVRTSSGVTFAQVIKPGVDVRMTALKEAVPMGIVAGDAECYGAFALAFDPCIEAYHGCKPSGSHPSALDPEAVEGGVVSSPHVVSVCIRAARNLGGLRMPTCCSFDERRKVESAVAGALSTLAGELKGEYFPLAGSSSLGSSAKAMPSSMSRALEMDGLALQEPKSTALLAAGVGRDWPDARGVFVNEDRSFAAWINEEEHVTLLSTRNDGDFKAAFGKLCSAEKLLDSALKQDGCGFAREDRLGYLTASPERLGTALTVSATLRLPRLSTSTDLQQMCASKGLRVVSQGRDGTVEVASQATLGVSEASLVASTASACSLLLAAEV